MRRKWDAYQTYLFLRGLSSFAFTIVFTINMVYQVRAVGLNPLQLVLVGTTLELAAFLFEIPTGVVADVYSRRLSIIIGYALIGVGFLVEAVPTFPTVILAQVIWGIGYTFTSGATDAWIVDEIGNERANQAFMRGSQVGQIASIIAIITGALLATVQLNYPNLVGGGALIGLSLALILVMPEDGFQRTPAGERDTWRDLFKTLGAGINQIRARHILLLIVLSSLIAGAFSEGWDRLWTKHLVDNITLPALGGYDPVLWFGVLGIVGSILALIATEAIRRMNLTSHKQLATATMIMYGLFGIGVIAFAQATNFVAALIVLWFVGTVRAVIGPVFMSWINLHIDSKVRATVLSVESQANALGQIGAGPVVGYIGLVSGLRIAISIAGVVMFPAVLLIARIRTMNAEQTISKVATP